MTRRQHPNRTYVLGLALIAMIGTVPASAQSPERLPAAHAVRSPNVPMAYAPGLPAIGPEARWRADARTVPPPLGTITPAARLPRHVELMARAMATSRLKLPSLPRLPYGLRLSFSERSALKNFYARRVLDYVRPGLSRASRTYRLSLGIRL